jgi:hypothetical protein
MCYRYYNLDAWSALFLFRRMKFHNPDVLMALRLRCLKMNLYLRMFHNPDG